MVELEWDETKRVANLEKHQLDFLICRRLFDGRPMWTIETPKFGEVRFLSTCKFEERFLTVIWTWRDGAYRIISLRRARNGEKAEYEALHGS